ncbi:MAG: hypothetical protein QOD75_2054 [Blastocatellia bacterium]|jgi:hypothetical protein|nr:hypothetical protein [Blastocatellia bacterium]
MATEPTQLTGKVVKGVIVIENGQRLPDGTVVRIEPVGETAPPDSVPDVNQLREMLLNHAGAISDSELPTDLSENLDHYLYGTAKTK